MKCIQCGNELPAESRFCPQCGMKVHERTAAVLKCQTCGGALTVNQEGTMLACPFCQSVQMIDEADEVVIQRIKSNAYKEVEIAKLRHEARMEKRLLEQNEKLEAKEHTYIGKHGKWATTCLVMGILSLFGSFSTFRSFRQMPLPSIMILLSIALFFAAWATGRRNGYGRTRAIHKVLVIAGWACFILWSQLIADTDVISTEPVITLESQLDASSVVNTYAVCGYVEPCAAIGKPSSSAL